jgi:chaperone BCS1
MINQLYHFVYNHPLKTNIPNEKSERILHQPGQEFVAMLLKVSKLGFGQPEILSFWLANLASHHPTNILSWNES